VQRNLRRQRSVTLASGVVLVCGCGGRAELEHAPSDDAGTTPDSGLLQCAPFIGCGGDLVGTWTLISTCLDMPVQQAGCETLQYTGNQSQATFEFSEAGTFRQDASAKYRLTTVIPAGCITSSCASFQDSYQTKIASNGSGTVTCSASDGGCVCNAEAETREVTSGQYSVSGASLTLALSPTTESGINSYCVSNDQLTLHESGFGSSVYSRN
jgi:hypothetical protein